MTTRAISTRVSELNAAIDFDTDVPCFRVALLLAAAGFVAGCSAGPCPAPAGPSRMMGPAVERGFEKVAFLLGDWDGTSSDGRFDEHWIAPRGGIMLGVGREVDSKGTGFFELMRIENRGNHLMLVPQPMGEPGRDFRLVRATPGGAVFENAGDDRVARISYSLGGDELVARVEFRTDGHVEEFRMRRALRER
jgi:hypothetical protein